MSLVNPLSLLKNVSLLSILIQVLFFASVAVAQETECSASIPCAIGCCSKFGFCGLGPDFCSPEVCVNNCQEKADCDPGSFGSEYVKKDKCPLNVCCSKHGFCGTTEEFCNGKKVKRPSCDANGQGFDRVVGYYEGWSANRPCNKFYPEQLPVGVYTHLNFAFASIDPTTFEVIPAASGDVDMYKRLTNLKKADPDLKVFIAVGGWTFNDPGPTATTFSDIARSEENTNKFIKSLISFMSTHNFDGIDLDWEYPVADDRSGREEDYKNFPVFLRKLKAALKASGGRDGLSITLPASYWYLQHFDIEAIQKDVDFLNMMTYDLHGTWDMENKWVGPFLNAHTNLTEINEALDLLWRNNINSDKVVLGMAFYGRAFTVANSGCTKPGCTYASGGKKRACSSEISVILNSEIEDVMASTGAKPTLYEDEAVKILNYEDNQWVAFDDGDTFKLRADFARKLCLGGLMVWAVSHDTKEAKYTAALAEAANRKFVAALPATDGEATTTVDKHAQCKWTNCAEQCPSGWTRVLRKDGGERGEEYMIDEQGCNGIGYHQLCCPPGDEQVTCGWYYHNNGKCGGSKCPTGMFEIGSNDMYCRSSYQPACCFGTATSMHLHNGCTWSKEYPHCDKATCADTNSQTVELASSMSGSGGAFCSEMGSRDIWGYPSTLSREERKYCCRDDLPDQKWTDCTWHDKLGFFPRDWANDDEYCLSGCPNDKVRVAMDHNTDKCSRGARAKCCTPAYSTVTKRAPEEDEQLSEALEMFLDQPTCTDDTQSYRYESQETVIMYLGKILYGSVSLATVNTWNDKVGGKYENLKYTPLRDWAKDDDDALRLGSTKLPETIACSLSYYDALIGGGSVLTCYGGSSDHPKKRSLEYLFDFNDTYAGQSGYNGPRSLSILEKRDEEYPISVFSPYLNRVVDFSIWGISYPSSGEWLPTEPIWNLIFDFTSMWCSEAAVGPIYRIPGNNDGLATEHIFERHAMALFIKHTIQNVLPGGAASAFNAIDPAFWMTTAFSRLPSNIPTIGAGEVAPIRRIMTSLGADNFRNVFVLAGTALNSAKEQVWLYNDPTAANTMRTMLADPAQIGDFLTKIRNALGSVLYLNTAEVHAKLSYIIGLIRQELNLADILHQQLNGVTVQAVARFDEWAKAHFEHLALTLQAWSLRWIGEARVMWNGANLNNHPWKLHVLAAIQILGALAAGVAVNLDGVPGLN